MHWVSVEELKDVNLVNDFEELVQVMLEDDLNEFQYVIHDGKWIAVLK